jgi:2-hydroxychromene-2-carboxylate isomerase
MAATIELYYDFRSPYAYFASHRLRSAEVARLGHQWKWRPVSVDALLNLQAGREPWAPYLDPLSAPKRAHLIADVRRLAAYYRLPLRAPRPQRPNSIRALFLTSLLDTRERSRFENAVFDALWQEQQDISAPDVLARCLVQAGAQVDLLDAAFANSARSELEEKTRRAYGAAYLGCRPSFSKTNCSSATTGWICCSGRSTDPANRDSSGSSQDDRG